MWSTIHMCALTGAAACVRRGTAAVPRAAASWRVHGHTQQHLGYMGQLIWSKGIERKLHTSPAKTAVPNGVKVD